METDPRTMGRKDLEEEILRLREALRTNQQLQKQMQSEITRLMIPAPPELATPTAGEDIPATGDLVSA